MWKKVQTKFVFGKTGPVFLNVIFSCQKGTSKTSESTIRACTNMYLWPFFVKKTVSFHFPLPLIKPYQFNTKGKNADRN